MNEHRYLGRTIPAMIAWSVGLALIGVWAGLYLGFITNWPVTFFISVIEVIVYLIVYLSKIIEKISIEMTQICVIFLIHFTLQLKRFHNKINL